MASAVLLAVFGALVSGPTAAADAERFVVKIQRTKKTENGLIIGNLYVNDKELGPVYEHPDKKIVASPAGKPDGGVIRTKSDHNFVQNPDGKLGKTGGFLLEIAGVPGRSNILIRAGNKPEHTEGCVRAGPATREKDVPFAPETVKKLRLAFYDGKDEPKSSPNKKIEVIVLDP